MARTEETNRASSRERALWLALEAPRALLEASTLPAALPGLARAPRGDGHPVLVLPGFLASDVSPRPLRAFLRERGFTAHGWGLGRNRGPDGGVLGVLRRKLDELSDGRRVSLVGWSLGGVFARELAKAAPERVRAVITLASPFGDREPPGAPCTAIYTRSDGIVDWQTCRERPAAHTENIEVVASHCGIGAHPLAWFAIADRLAQPDGAWKPFDRSGLRGALFG
jgi:pimeloyl-ACP methyl ester carboxylesterase